MDLGLQGKVVAITGGAAGIGLACTLGFLKEGCKVAICGRTPEKLEEAKKQANQLGYHLLTQVADVSKTSDVKAFANAVYESYGSIDIWINNAGVMCQKTIIEMSENEWDEILSVNLKSVFIGSKAAYRYMKDKGGVILNASSFAAVIPSAGSGAYAAAKAAVTSLTRTLAAEFAPYNIRVNAYIPGVIKTDMNAKRIDQWEDQLKAQIALNSLAEAEEVVPAILFLASDVSRYITGTSIEISGGKFCVQNPYYPWQIS